jgi:hypothetical protein
VLIVLVRVESAGHRLPNPKPNLKQIPEGHWRGPMTIQYPVSVVVLGSILVQFLVDHLGRLVPALE